MMFPRDYYLIHAYKQDRPRKCVALVTEHSPMRLRRMVETYGIYFLKEMNTDCMFTAKGDTGYAAYLFGNGDRWVGACCFRRTYGDGQWILWWIWIHPFYRLRGMLTWAWPQLEARHGKFLLLRPLSPAMHAFVEARGVAKGRIATESGRPAAMDED